MFSPAHHAATVADAQFPVLASDILVADGGVEGLEGLLQGLNPGTDLRLIGSRQNPWPVLIELLSRPGLERCHLLAHGRPGELWLGRLRLREAWLHRLAPLQRHPSPPVICLWSCSTAAGVAGWRFLQALADWTGSPVFAASAPVGAASQGGSWQLDVCANPRSCLGRAGPRDALRAVAEPPPPMNRARPSPPIPKPR